ncbi:hypothetical protein [Neorhodopirellula pilleata]|uniref:Nucleotidyltransferase family protein n=1 Tax=Neorhodopirellula pilleata TaxID=2714738 RepID=A0A5C5ZLF8_9BACT|nr:hypothetical protein [Neorhodopirellula pilleata]TWT88038.1 hypothetical protein Pla100_57690 [Neorhodopirellula pilleata]
MSQADLLALVVGILHELGIPHMVVGAHASSLHGEPRSTHDVDMVIDLAPAKIDALAERFEPTRYYISKSALREGRMANVIDLQTGDKLDLFLLQDDPHSQLAMNRRQPAEIMGVAVDVSSPEDTILAKLTWDKLCGGSERQRTDITQILRIRGASLDDGYLRQQAEIAGTIEIWLDLRASVQTNNETNDRNA